MFSFFMIILFFISSEGSDFENIEKISNLIVEKYKKESCLGCEIEVLDLYFSQKGLQTSDIEFRGPSPVYGQNQEGQIIVKVSGSKKVLPVRFRLFAQRKLPVAVRDILPGEDLFSHDFIWEKREVKPFITYPRTSSSLENATAQQFIPEGHVVNMNDIMKRVMVRSGDDVDVYVIESGMKLRFSGLALASGSIGDDLFVRIPQTGRILRARVFEKKKLRVGGGL